MVEPFAPTENVADWPALTVWLVGCDEIVRLEVEPPEDFVPEEPACVRPTHPDTDMRAKVETAKMKREAFVPARRVVLFAIVIR